MAPLRDPEAEMFKDVSCIDSAKKNYLLAKKKSK